MRNQSGRQSHGLTNSDQPSRLGCRIGGDFASLVAISAWTLLLTLAPLLAMDADAAPPSNAHLSYFGGNIVEHPMYVNIFWGAFWTVGTGLSERHALSSFVQTVGTSSEFNSVLQQYTGPGGVFPHPGSFLGETLIVTEPGGSSKVIADSQIQDAIDSWIKAGLVPAPTVDLIYNVYFPQGVVVTMGTESSGSTFCSYHNTLQTTLGTGGLIRYIAMPHADAAGCLFEATEVDSLTVEMSHQMAEAVTDPDVGLATAADDPNLGWYDNNNGEIGDICAGQPDATLLGFRVQTLWSNADDACIAIRIPSTDTTPPVITPTITGTLGNNGWYTSDVAITWAVSDPESPISSMTGCDPTTINYDTGPVILTCTATSAGGTATQSIMVKRDATNPTVTYSGNAGSYTLDQTVSISCVASDNLSGIASSTCASISGPAYSFSIGANTFTASAGDNAGNSAVGSTTFTVIESTDGLFQLTMQFVQTSPVYQALSPRQKSVVDRRVDAVEHILSAIQPGSNQKQKTALINVYEGEIAAFVRAGWLTPGQAAVLDNIANAL